MVCQCVFIWHEWWSLLTCINVMWFLSSCLCSARSLTHVKLKENGALQELSIIIINIYNTTVNIYRDCIISLIKIITKETCYFCLKGSCGPKSKVMATKMNTDKWSFFWVMITNMQDKHCHTDTWCPEKRATVHVLQNFAVWWTNTSGCTAVASHADIAVLTTLLCTA